MSPSRYFSLERTGDTLIAMPGRQISSLGGSELSQERSVLVDEIQNPEVRSMLVDFEKLEYFGSLMLDTLCVAWNQLRDRGGSMALCNVSDVGKEILAKSRLDSLWQIYPSRQNALDALNAIEAATKGNKESDTTDFGRRQENSGSRLHVLETGPRTVVGFGGADLPPDHAVGRYLEQIQQLIESNGCRELSFDMTGVSTIPSGFLGVLASVLKQGVELSVKNPSKDVRDVLTLTNLDRAVRME